ncbi:MAG TPA: cupin domain-containing protein [Candidatus Saccharimonadia bacterium]|nr:cupin domain-containing protein [Candidatus Saccharimonadia bacterium]
MAQNFGKSFVGRVDDHIQGKGWFFGAFMPEPLLRSDDVEVAWNKLPSQSPSPEQAHMHKVAIEINIVIQGWIKLTIDGQGHELHRGDFYIIWPGSVVADISTSEDAELICIKAPSLPGDKFPVG